MKKDEEKEHFSINWKKGLKGTAKSYKRWNRIKHKLKTNNLKGLKITKKMKITEKDHKRQKGR